MPDKLEEISEYIAMAREEHRLGNYRDVKDALDVVKDLMPHLGILSLDERFKSLERDYILLRSKIFFRNF